MDGFLAWWNDQSFMNKLGWIVILFAILSLILIVLNTVTSTGGVRVLIETRDGS